jgi:hypothetical protein
MRHLLLLGLTLILAGCSCVVLVSVSGSIQGGVKIEAERNSSVFTKHAVFYSLSIHEVGCDGTGPLWAIRGKAKVNVISYGKVPSGMSEVAPAKPLEAGKRYVVTLLADAGVTCNAQMAFTIGSQGNVEAFTRRSSACG